MPNFRSKFIFLLPDFCSKFIFAKARLIEIDNEEMRPIMFEIVVTAIPPYEEKNVSQTLIQEIRI